MASTSSFSSKKTAGRETISDGTVGFSSALSSCISCCCGSGLPSDDITRMNVGRYVILGDERRRKCKCGGSDTARVVCDAK
jgi:hypothetical protein